MITLDIRHLYGSNRFLDGPAIQILLDPESQPPELILEKVLEALHRGARKLSWPPLNIRARIKPRWIAICMEAPHLDAYWHLAHVALAAATAKMDQETFPWEEQLAPAVRALKAETKDEPLATILSTARQNKIPVMMLGEEDLLLGHGAKSQRLPMSDLTGIDWPKLGRIPVFAITGTNGKTTCTRLLARVFKECGLCVGNTSSDGIQIDGKWYFEGDCTGPDSMRDVLAHPEVEVAVLEAARGGILRRGLGVDLCDIALVTNISPDHLGIGGIDTLDEMAELKSAIVRALSPNGTAVLSADDVRVRSMARPDRKTWYFARQRDLFVNIHLGMGGSATYLTDKDLVAAQGQRKIFSMPIAEIPITLGGAARHNAENAAAVLACALAYGVPEAAIRRAFANFQPNPTDNPGRVNFFSYNGATVIVDFAHNVDGIRTLMNTVRNLPASRRIIVIGQAGDRSDELIQEEAKAAWEGFPNLIIIKETQEQLRGRQLGEVPRLFHNAFRALGASESMLVHEDSEVNGVRRALAECREGDLVLLMVHLMREQTFRMLAGRPPFSDPNLLAEEKK